MKTIREVELEERVQKLKEENLNLKKRLTWEQNINKKAIEYIEKQRYAEKNHIGSLAPFEVDRLLNILKGSDKEWVKKNYIN